MIIEEVVSKALKVALIPKIRRSLEQQGYTLDEVKFLEQRDAMYVFNILIHKQKQVYEGILDIEPWGEDMGDVWTFIDQETHEEIEIEIKF